MRKLYNPKDYNSVTHAAKQMAVEHNVTLRVIDIETHEVVQTHEGHNAATNTLLTGIAHYLVGDGVYNQAYEMLSRFLPRYISLGTMGLICQDADELGLPVGLGSFTDTLDVPEIQRLCNYISECPGFGADGYDVNSNSDRPYFGLGPIFEERESEGTVNCELISKNYPRNAIAYRSIVPESEAEIPKTIDVIYSAIVSTGALREFREENEDFIFVTEAGLWARPDYVHGGDNGLLAAYRILPPDSSQWDLGTYIEGTYDEEGAEITPPHYELDPNDPEHAAKQAHNQEVLKKNILRVGKNQVVQVIWKIQIGGLDQLGGMGELYPSLQPQGTWQFWDSIIE